MEFDRGMVVEAGDAGAPSSPGAGVEIRAAAADRPFVESVVDALLAHGPDAAARTLCVVPGGRARRLVLRAWLGRAGSELVEPPEIVTPAGLVERARRALGLPPAPSVLERRLAWHAVLAEMPQQAAALGAGPRPNAGDPAPADLRAAAARLDRLVTELATAGRRPEEVPDAVASIGRFEDIEIWGDVAAIETAWRRRLAEAGLGDAEGLDLPVSGGPEPGPAAAAGDWDRLVIAGVPELTAAQRRAMSAVASAESSVAVIAADSSDAAAFDAAGCPRPAAWLGRAAAPADEELLVADDPESQAAMVVAAVAGASSSADGDLAVDELALGVVDPEIVPVIRAALAASGARVRSAAGRRFADGEPAAILANIVDWAGGGDRPPAEVVAALARSPRIAAVVRAWGAEAADTADLPGKIDVEGSDAASDADEPDDGRHRATAGDLSADADAWWRSRVPREVESRLLQPAIGQLVDWLEAHVDGPLVGDDARRPATEWGHDIARLVAALNADRVTVSAERSDAAVDEPDWLAVARIAERLGGIDASLAPSVRGVEALSIVLAAAEDEVAPEPPDRQAIDVLGWLELVFDPAPTAIVAGVHDASLPGRSAFDPLLPESLRRALGLADDRARLGRDAAVVAGIRRHRERMLFVAGRRASDSVPLVPSRVLLEVEAGQVAARLARLVGGDTPARALEIVAAAPMRVDDVEAESGPGERATRSPFDVPALPPLGPLASMRATEFRLAMACPYRHALLRRLGLEPRGEVPVELTAAQFGDLAHRVLEAFGRDEKIRGSSDANAITTWLVDALHERIRRSFGAQPRAAIRLQSARLEQRLVAFAHRQAESRGAGWRIAAVEWDLPPDRRLEIPGDDPVTIRGRIDRLDIHEVTQAWRIIDYKTGDTAKSPSKAHFGRERAPAEPNWIDVQLPLYRHLVVGCRPSESWPAIEQPPEVGYVQLPRSVDGVGWKPANWSDDVVDSGLDAARACVHRLRHEPIEGPVRLGRGWDPCPWICRSGAILFAGAGEDDEGAGDGGGAG